MQDQFSASFFHQLVQNAGEYVVTFPRSYHLGFSHGFNCGEAANFATPGWLEVAKEAAVRRVALNHLPMLSHQQLLYYHAMSFPSRTSLSLGSKLRSSRLELKKKSLGEEIVKTKFVNDVIYSNTLIKDLLHCGVSSCLVFADILKTPESNLSWFSNIASDLHSSEDLLRMAGLRSLEGLHMPHLVSEQSNLACRGTVDDCKRLDQKTILDSTMSTCFSLKAEEKLLLANLPSSENEANSNFQNNRLSNCNAKSQSLKDNLHTSLRGSFIDWESLSCAACGSLCFLSMAIIQPTLTAACTFRHPQLRDTSKYQVSSTIAGTSSENELGGMESGIGRANVPIIKQMAASCGLEQGDVGHVSAARNAPEGITCTRIDHGVWYSLSSAPIVRNSSRDDNSLKENPSIGNSDSKESEPMDPVTIDFRINLPVKQLLKADEMDEIEFTKVNAEDIQGTAFYDKGLVKQRFLDATLDDAQVLKTEAAQSFDTTLTSLQLLAAAYDNESESDDDESFSDEGNPLCFLPDSILGDNVDAVGLSADAPWESVVRPLSEMENTTVSEVGKIGPAISLPKMSPGVELLDRNFIFKGLLIPETDAGTLEMPVLKDNVPYRDTDETTSGVVHGTSLIETEVSKSTRKTSTHGEKNVGVKDIASAEHKSSETSDDQSIPDHLSCLNKELLPNEKDGIGAVNSICNGWQGHDLARPRIMCLEHAYKAQLQLQSRGGGHVLVIFHPSFQDFEQRAQFLAMELGINHEWTKAPISSPHKDHSQIVNAAIDAAHDHTLADHDWVAQLGMNVRHSYKMKERPSEDVEGLEDRGLYGSANHSRVPLSFGNLQSEPVPKSSPRNLLRTRLHPGNRSSKSTLENKPGGKHLKEKKCWVVGRWCGRDWRLDQVHVLLGGCRETPEPSKFFSLVTTTLGPSTIGISETVNNSMEAFQSLWSKSTDGTQTCEDSSSSEEQHQLALKTSCKKRKDRGQKIVALYARKQRQHINTIQSSRYKRKINMVDSYKQKDPGHISRKIGRKRKLVAMDLYSDQEASVTLLKTGSCHQEKRRIAVEGPGDAHVLCQCSSGNGSEIVPSFASEVNVMHSDGNTEAENQALGALQSPAASLPEMQILNFTSDFEKNCKQNACKKSWKFHPAALHSSEAHQLTFMSVEPRVQCGSPSRTAVVQSNCSPVCVPPWSPSTEGYHISPSSLPRDESLSLLGPSVAEVVNDNATSYARLCSAVSCVSNSRKSNRSGLNTQTDVFTSKASEELMLNLDGPSRSVWCDVPIVCAPALDSRVARKAQQSIYCDEKSSCCCWVSQEGFKERTSLVSAACTKLCVDSSQVSCNLTESSSAVLEVGESLDTPDCGLHHQLISASEKLLLTGSCNKLEENCGRRPELKLKDVNADIEELDTSKREYLSSQHVPNSMYQMVPCKIGALESVKICNQINGSAFCEHSHCFCCDRQKAHHNDQISVVSNTSTEDIQAKGCDIQVVKHEELGSANEGCIDCTLNNSQHLFPIADSGCWPCQGDTPVSGTISDCDFEGEARNVAKSCSGVAEVHEEQTRIYRCSIVQCSGSKERVVKPFSKLRSKRLKHSGWKKSLQNLPEEDILSQESRDHQAEASELLCSGGPFNDNSVTSSGEQDLDLAKLKQTEILDCQKGDSCPGPFTRLRSRCSTTAANVQDETSTDDTLKNVKGKIAKKAVRKVRKHPNVTDNEEGSKPHRCDIDGCGMGFTTNKELVLHMNNMCTFKGCGKRLCTHNYLLQHFRVHIDDRPLKCPWKGCKKTFKWAWARTEHIRVHTGERPYVCQVCNKRYRFVSDFSRHKRTTGHTPNT
ncbi:hypothetical protein O6H91_01G075600 [Diphasiastrum complanatum]|uniref:Uncharacterized protein n=1 Tax=Diphasiastrum complanatum TaxID=34168 RepID=A0ACC2ESK3_DIPCM|nr:hypothetical protein O6H91_01G075600 [Diphasiastrum complanatum]